MQHGQYEKEKKRANDTWNEFFDMVSRKREAHEAYMNHGVIPAEEIISKDIVESWKRSLEQGLDPGHIEPVYIEGPDFEKILEENKNLLSAADPILEEFALQFSTSLFIVDLYDKNSCLLKRYGKREKNAKDQSYIRPGLIKTEKASGATSMSCAIMRGEAAQLVGGEHFAENLLENVCTAAPVYFEGELVGLVNVIELQWKKDSRTLGTLVGLAKLIENNYEQQKLRRQIAEEAAVYEEMIRSTSEGILLISAAGDVIKASPHACTLLGVSKNRLEGHNIKEIFEKDNLIKRAVAHRISVGEQEINVSIDGSTKRFMGYIKTIQSDGEVSKIMVAFKDMQSLRNIFKNVGGWDAKYTFDDIIGSSPVFRQAVELAKDTAILDSNTLIEGESGTGKELFAQAIHNASRFSQGPFVSVNCGSIPASLLESELFGYESGSFTGARKGGQIGKFELAEGGTIFLDEINSLPVDMQVKLLRVLQEKKICRVGGSHNVQLHIKIIAASNEDLWELVQKGGFRADLFYRLNVITIHIPSLYQHPDDIPEISKEILSRIVTSGETARISDKANQILMHYRWPGNVRELENTVERGFINARRRGENLIDVADIETVIQVKKQSSWQKSDEKKEMDQNIRQHMESDADREIDRDIENIREDMHRLRATDEREEKEAILNALKKHRGNISASARELGMSRNTLYQRIYKYDIRIKNY